MYKSYDHFKEISKAVYDALRSNPSMKLSEFRNLFIEGSDYDSLQAYADSFNALKELLKNDVNKPLSPEFELISLFSRGIIIKHISLDIVIDQYETNDEFIILKSSEDNFFEIALEKDELFIVTSQDDPTVFEIGGALVEPIEVKLFEPMLNSTRKPLIGVGANLDLMERDTSKLAFKASEIKPVTDIVSVIIISNGDMDIYASFPDNRDNELKVRNAFVNAMEEKLSNFDEYSQDDIEDCLENERENFGAGSIQIVRSEVSY